MTSNNQHTPTTTTTTTNNDDDNDLSDEEILLTPSPRKPTTTTSTPLISNSISSLTSSLSHLTLSQKLPKGNNRILVILDLNGLFVHRERIQGSKSITPDHSIIKSNNLTPLTSSTSNSNSKSNSKSSSSTPQHQHQQQSSSSPSSSSILNHRQPDAKHNQSWLYVRKHSTTFLQFLFEHFDVAIWSAAQRTNVLAMIKLILPDDLEKFIFIYDQSHCTLGPGINPENPHKPIFLKELSKVWKSFPQYNERTTILIDDTPYKCVLNPPHTAIHPPEMTPNDLDDDMLAIPNGPLAIYLSKLITFWTATTTTDDNDINHKQNQITLKNVSDFIRLNQFSLL
jgi:hypothetical protein